MFFVPFMVPASAFARRHEASSLAETARNFQIQRPLTMKRMKGVKGELLLK
jgi:hypothetical protein